MATLKPNAETKVVAFRAKPEVAHLIGDWSGRRCPVCQAETLVNANGDEWCSLIGCTWKRED